MGVSGRENFPDTSFFGVLFPWLSDVSMVYPLFKKDFLWPGMKKYINSG